MGRLRQGDRGLEVLEKFKGLVLKLSWQYWKRLPQHTKVWVDPDDLIEDAYLYVLSRAADTYDKEKASRCTFLWVGVNNLLLNFAMSQQTKKRFGWNVPVEELEVIGKPDPSVAGMEARDALNKIYNEASDELKKEMQNWFGPIRPRLRTKRVHENRREFLALATKHRLTEDDCRHLMGSVVWVN